jgi:hypothetical protein
MSGAIKVGKRGTVILPAKLQRPLRNRREKDRGRVRVTLAAPLDGRRRTSFCEGGAPHPGPLPPGEGESRG